MFPTARHTQEDSCICSSMDGLSGLVLVAKPCPTLCDPMVCPWTFPGKNTGVGCHSLLQGIFPAQGLFQDLLHCRLILYCLSYQRLSGHFANLNKKYERRQISLYHLYMETLKNLHSWTQIVEYWLPGTRGDGGDRNQKRLVKGGKKQCGID